MSEFLSSMLKATMYGWWIVCMIVGFYFAASGLAADAQIQNWSNAYHSSASIQQKAKLKAMYNEWPWDKLMIEAFGRPKVVWSLIQEPMPWLNPSEVIPAGLSHYNYNWTWANFFWHQGVFILIALLMAWFGEYYVYPTCRSKLAHWLTSSKRKIFGSKKDLDLGDGMVVAKGIQLTSKGINPHVLSVGPSGLGKSSSQATNSLFALSDDCAVICADVKGELCARTSNYLRKRGHEIYVIGPMEGVGHGWDPLKECRDYDEVRELARMMLASSSGQVVTKDQTWINMSRSCLSSYLIQAMSTGKGLSVALDMLYEDKASGGEISHSEAIKDFQMFKTMLGSGGTTGSVFGTIQSAVAPWRSTKVSAWLECERQFRFADVRSKKAVVYLITSAAGMQASQQVQQVFYSMLFSRLAEGGVERVRILLDEFGNLGALEGIQSALTLLRSANVVLHAFIQNLRQLETAYGSHLGRVLAEGFGTVCVFAGLRNDADELGKLLGIQDDVRESYNTSDSHLRPQFGQVQQQVLQGSLLRQIPTDRVLIISNNKKPVLAKLQPWYLIRKYHKKVPQPFRLDWGCVDKKDIESLFSSFGKIEMKPDMLVSREIKIKKNQDDQGDESSFKTERNSEINWNELFE